MEAYGLKVMSIGFLVEEEAAMIWRGPMVMSAITQMLREVAWGDLDVLVVDMPPGTGDAQLTMAQATPLAGAVIVSTPQDLALIDARRGVSMFKRVEIPILGIVENMATFICPHCGQSSHIFGHGGARHEAERLGVPFLGEVPLDMSIRELSDAGRPVVAVDPEGPHAADLQGHGAAGLDQPCRAALPRARRRASSSSERPAWCLPLRPSASSSRAGCHGAWAATTRRSWPSKGARCSSMSPSASHRNAKSVILNANGDPSRFGSVHLPDRAGFRCRTTRGLWPASWRLSNGLPFIGRTSAGL